METRYLYISIFLVLTVFFGYALFITSLVPGSEYTLEKLAQFGDSFGVLNSLFSGMAFAGLILTIFYQRRDLSIQLDSLRDNQERLSEQNIMLRKQMFETTFFNMLSRYTDLVADFRLSRRLDLDKENMERAGVESTGEYRGSQYFRVVYSEFRDEYTKYATNTWKSHGRPDWDLYCIEESLLKKIGEDRFRMRSYFNMVRSIVNLIVRSEFSNEETDLYLDLFSSQMSDSEVLVLFYFNASRPNRNVIRFLHSRSRRLYEIPDSEFADHRFSKQTGNAFPHMSHRKLYLQESIYK